MPKDDRAIVDEAVQMVRAMQDVLVEDGQPHFARALSQVGYDLAQCDSVGPVRALELAQSSYGALLGGMGSLNDVYLGSPEANERLHDLRRRLWNLFNERRVIGRLGDAGSDDGQRAVSEPRPTSDRSERFVRYTHPRAQRIGSWLLVALGLPFLCCPAYRVFFEAANLTEDEWGMVLSVPLLAFAFFALGLRPQRRMEIDFARRLVLERRIGLPWVLERRHRLSAQASVVSLPREGSFATWPTGASTIDERQGTYWEVHLVDGAARFPLATLLDQHAAEDLEAWARRLLEMAP